MCFYMSTGTWIKGSLPNKLHWDGCLIRGSDRVLNHDQSKSLNVSIELGFLSNKTLITYDFGQEIIFTFLRWLRSLRSNTTNCITFNFIQVSQSNLTYCCFTSAFLRSCLLVQKFLLKHVKQLTQGLQAHFYVRPTDISSLFLVRSV